MEPVGQHARSSNLRECDARGPVFSTFEARDAARPGPGSPSKSRPRKVQDGDGKSVDRAFRPSLEAGRGRSVRIPGYPGIRTS